MDDERQVVIVADRNGELVGWDYVTRVWRVGGLEGGYLYALDRGGWAWHRWLGLELAAQTPAESLTEAEALRCLLAGGFSPPADLADLAEEWRLTPASVHFRNACRRKRKHKRARQAHDGSAGNGTMAGKHEADPR